jgi:hypothetical protein
MERSNPLGQAHRGQPVPCYRNLCSTLCHDNNLVGDAYDTPILTRCLWCLWCLWVTYTPDPSPPSPCTPTAIMWHAPTTSCTTPLYPNDSNVTCAHTPICPAMVMCNSPPTPHDPTGRQVKMISSLICPMFDRISFQYIAYSWFIIVFDFLWFPSNLSFCMFYHFVEFADLDRMYWSSYFVLFLELFELAESTAPLFAQNGAFESFRPGA